MFRSLDRSPFITIFPFGLIALLLCAGCSQKPSWQVEVHPAKGTCWINGEPAHRAKMIWFSKNGPIDKRETIPHAIVQEDGTFQVTTYEENDGVPEGEYDVILYWLDNPWEAKAADRLRGRYGKPESPLKTITIVPGENELEPIDLNVPGLLPADENASPY